MLLATYQPTNSNSMTLQEHKYDMISNILGYAPIWCISAETLEEFLYESLFCLPNYGEELIIFETDEYDTIDKCKWYKCIKNNAETVDPSLFNSDCRFKEYLVKKINNIILRIPMDSNRISIERTDFAVDKMAQMYLTKAREYQATFVSVSNINPYETPPLFQAYIMLNITSGFLPFVYANNIKHNTLDCLRFHGESPDIKSIYRDFSHWQMFDCSEEKYAIVVKHFCELFDKSIDVSRCKLQRKIGRNEPCPCGSGKKYKKCCGRNY